MPNLKSAKKALKQNLKKRSRNNHFKALYKEKSKEFEKSIKSWNVEQAQALLPFVYSNIDKLIKKNIIHINNWARRKSKYAKLLKTIEVSK